MEITDQMYNHVNPLPVLGREVPLLPNLPSFLLYITVITPILDGQLPFVCHARAPCVQQAGTELCP